jgi:hypothetical protein
MSLQGEVVLTRAAHAQGVIQVRLRLSSVFLLCTFSPPSSSCMQMCPTLASCSLEEMMAARAPGQTQWFQLYVNKNRAITEALVRKAEQVHT